MAQTAQNTLHSNQNSIIVSISEKTKNKQKTFGKTLYVYIFDPLKPDRYDSKSNFQPESTKKQIDKYIGIAMGDTFFVVFLHLSVRAQAYEC